MALCYYLEGHGVAVCLAAATVRLVVHHYTGMDALHASWVYTVATLSICMSQVIGVNVIASIHHLIG